MKAWLFDVDGVITALEKKTVVEQQILHEIIKLLYRGDIICLNTGRSMDFLLTEVTNPLEAIIEDKTYLSNLISIAEKGAIWITYDLEGKQKEFIDHSLDIPEELKSKLDKIVIDGFSDIVFIDETKQVMYSAELLPGKTVSEFQPRQDELVKELKKAVDQYDDPLNEILVDPTTIAIDVENIKSGKSLGVRIMLSILERRKIKPDKFIAFGDSASDLEMGEELEIHETSFEFVYVGKNLSKKISFPITRTEKFYDEGTLEFLRSH